ncbi:thiohydroximate-O-sulfate sulfur/sulfate-lyase (nitrile-forming) NSP5 [Aristolochia californica]|uniref:thiohydroximate-O-sulfate sulfur/sulfate-lyase (nitrile-forming) NSP5 n=1 Tax=Aristolochia californica TaxID=171875 RepID=UPI0035DAD58B
MAYSQGKWVKLSQKGAVPGARSSHAITVVGNKAYVFGGELVPRVPVDNKLLVFDLGNLTWSITDASGDVPPPRLGVTTAAVGEVIYVFGGRDGDHKELNELYAFDTRTNKWALVSSGEVGPPHRSYHSIASDDRRVYIFGGCGVSGRLNDLWAYDVIDGEWLQYAAAGAACRGRGGPGLAVIDGRIWVVYGFAGEEVDDVHCFDPSSGKWSQVETTGEKPSPRSVFSTAGIGKYVFIYGGEIDPSDQGHLGAGKFGGEVYALDTQTGDWRKWGEEVESGSHPGPRGWCAFSAARRGKEEGLLVYGGNSPTNDRLDDIYIFTPSL